MQPINIKLTQARGYRRKFRASCEREVGLNGGGIM